MRMRGISVLAAVAVTNLAIAGDGEVSIDGSAPAIRKVVSGKTCVGNDTLRFGESIAGSPGRFERVGRPEGLYAIGYGTILIRRGNDLHGHIAAVSVPTRTLYLSTGTYRCGP